MVSHEDLEAASSSLRMVIAGLAEEVLDWVATPDPPAHEARTHNLQKANTVAEDLALVTSVLVMLSRCGDGRF